MFMRTVIAAALLLLSVLPQSVGAAESDASRQYGYVLERTGAGSASFSISVMSSFHQAPAGERDPAVVAAVGIVEDAESLRPVAVALVGNSDDKAPSAYHDGDRYGCEEAGCGVLGHLGATGTWFSYDDDDAAERISSFLVAVDSSEEPVITLEADGWRLRELPLSFRYSTREGNERSTGLDIGAYSPEVFRGARLPGGDAGSIAIAAPPCSYEMFGEGQGVGSATLRGGIEEPAVSCPGRGRPVAAFAPATTEWAFEADPVVIGRAFLSEVRLLVIDLADDDELAAD